MNITTNERARLETALDELAIALEAPGDAMARFRALRSYAQAIKVVREPPAGERRIRSDQGQRRAVPGQQVIEA